MQILFIGCARFSHLPIIAACTQNKHSVQSGRAMIKNSTFAMFAEGNWSKCEMLHSNNRASTTIARIRFSPKNENCPAYVFVH